MNAFTLFSRSLTITLLILAFCCLGLAQQTAQQSTVSVDGQWEYLVVSFGKTSFSNPIQDTTSRTLSKALQYFNSGIGLSLSEAIITEDNMDTLGKFGWELVGIVGAIGGDQQLVFKRKLDPNRAKLDAELIAKEGAQTDIQAPKTSSQQLVDLDQLEKQQAILDKRQKLVQAGQAIVRQAVKVPIVSLGGVSRFTSTVESNLAMTTIMAQIDLTSQVLNGNQYRSSKVQGLLKDISDAILQTQGYDKIDCAIFGSFYYTIKLVAVVKFNSSEGLLKVRVVQ